MFLRFMSERWLFSLSLSACSVSPTYCRPHRLHWIRYTTSFDLQVAADRRVYVLSVQWLVNLSVVIRAGQVLHCDRPQGVLPGGVGCMRSKVFPHQQISQVLWPTVCDDGRLGEGLFGSLR